MTPIVTVEEDYDLEYASDGISRFGAYVRQRAHLFVDDWEPLSPATFAVTVWTIATSPVMSPGYVHVRPDIWSATCRHGDEPGTVVAEIEYRLPWPVAMRTAAELSGWVSWLRIRRPDHDVPMSVTPPEDRPAVLVGALLRLSVSADLLPTPSRFAALDVAVAKKAIAVLCSEINAHAAPVLSRLENLQTSEVQR